LGRPIIRKGHTSLAGIAASLILVAIVHHEVEAIRVTLDKATRDCHVPAAFGAVALVPWGGRRNRIRLMRPRIRPHAIEVPGVRSRVSVRSDRYCVGGLVYRSDGSFPCPEDRIRRSPRAAKLPVARKLSNARRNPCYVCNEHRWEHWATRRVDAPLSLGGPSHRGYYVIRGVVHHRRNRVASCGHTPAGGYHINLANTQREGVFVTVEELQRLGDAVLSHPRQSEGG